MDTPFGRLRSSPAFCASLPLTTRYSKRGAATSTRSEPLCCTSSSDKRATPAAAPDEGRKPRVTIASGGAKNSGPAITLDEAMQSMQDVPDPLWPLIRNNAKSIATTEPQLASKIYGSILSHETLDEAVATILAESLASSFGGEGEGLQTLQLLELFRGSLQASGTFMAAYRRDLIAVMNRDPAVGGPAEVLLYHKGWKALQSYRLANSLWGNERHSLATYIQSLISSIYSIDIHPACKIGSGIFIDHGIGIVIGETATLGNDVSLLQNVTLGGTGKEKGDRHPKVADGVMIGAGATILGNIRIGQGAHVAACSVVLKPVEDFSVVSGVPAKVVGKVSYKKGTYPSFVMDQRLSIEKLGAKNPYQDTITGDVAATMLGEEEDLAKYEGSAI